MFKQLCSCKGVGIVEGRLMPDHVRMLASIPPKISAPGKLCVKECEDLFGRK
ncbi:hypothetical protein GMI70_06615 [Eggerthellaceae bacterium zg-893]|nr:hypothetical protein [Eggerthellaceae bacterium zg-893]